MGKQPSTGQKKSKKEISAAASSRSKGGRKKWTKGKVKDRANNAVFLDKPTYDTIATGIIKMGKVLTVATIVEKFKINGSVARKVLTHFSEKGDIVRVGDGHSKF